MASRPSSPIPAGAGIGLKPMHYADILSAKPSLGFFEVHAENYMGAGGPPHRYLEAIRAHYPISVHGVGLNIGASGPLDWDHLMRLKAVVDRYEPGLVSEHLAWSSHGEVFYNDLLPLPLTKETLARVAEHVDEVQTVLGRRILIENPSTYVAFASSAIPETEFLTELAACSGCGLLLDVNNAFVSATNHGFDIIDYLDAFPAGKVEEIHLAGHAIDEDEAGRPLLIDAHDRAVADPVWAAYAVGLQRTGPVPTLIERDNDVPALSALLAEAEIAERELAGCRTAVAAKAGAAEEIHAAL
ncbi:MAG: DUF692 domain-containing protein [Hyphomicrobiales bacterium]|nr:DUF692 domain-containing protein [Hyphomicrobiales bacterium]